LEPVQRLVGGRGMERPHGLLAERAVQGVRELRAQGDGTADAGVSRGGTHEVDPERRPEPRVSLRRQGDRRRHDPSGWGHEMPVVRGGPGPRHSGAEPGAEDEEWIRDDERELGLGPAHRRLLTLGDAADRQGQLMPPETIPVIRPLEPGVAYRSGRPINLFLIA
jgi:hypothetical protein